VRRELAPVTAYGEMLGGPIVLTGPRGVGKTSLLREIRLMAEADGYAVARTSGVKFGPFLGDVLRRVTTALDRLDLDPAEPRRRQIDELSATIGGSLASVGARVKWAPREGPPDIPPALLSPVEDLLHRAATLVRERGGAGLLILIDELHEPLLSRTREDYRPAPGPLLDAAILLNALQDLDDDREQNPLGVIAAGLPETTDFLTRAATFAERTYEIRLTELDDVTSREVLSRPAIDLGVTWHADALDAATDIGDGYPQALHVVGKWTWEQAAPTDGDEVTLQHLQAALPTIRGQLDNMHRRRWNAATESEREFLRAIARLTDPDRQDGAVRRADIARAMDRSTRSISDVRQNCISKGIVEEVGHGLLRFTMPGFAQYIVADAGSPEQAGAELEADDEPDSDDPDSDDPDGDYPEGATRGRPSTQGYDDPGGGTTSRTPPSL